MSIDLLDSGRIARSVEAAHFPAGGGSMGIDAAPCRVGIDIVQVSRIQESLERFGARFVDRLYTPAEAAYAGAAPGLQAERLAARFAAKEAALKALQLTDAGVDWREIEVCRDATGACRLALHGKAASLVYRHGGLAIGLSMSHDGDYAVAVVTAVGPDPVSLSACGHFND